MTSRRRPNVLLIVADDHAANAVGCYGGPHQVTPQIDRIAREGIRFDACSCTNSLCSPSRATILTGTYNHVNGVTTLSTEFDARQPVFPGLLRDAGYRTALIGKWHLGHGAEHDPRGFDHWEVLPDQGDYHDPEFLTMDGGSHVRPGYATDLITDLSLDWLDSTGDEPWCLLVQHKAPHRPWEPAERHRTLFDDVDIAVPETFFDDYEHRAEAARAARMRVARDLNLEDLKEEPPTGLDPVERANWTFRRYIVVYTSDQGFFLGEHGWYDKRFMYAESLQMPLLVRYPPIIEPGSTSEALVLNVDFAQTFLGLCGVDPHPRMQGRSMLPLLAGRTPEEAEWRTSAYYRYWEHLDGCHRVAAHRGIRTGDRKLVHYYGSGCGQPGASNQETAPEWELFDLEADPQEMRSVYDDPAYADDVRQLRTELDQLAKEIGDDLPPTLSSTTPTEESP